MTRRREQDSKATAGSTPKQSGKGKKGAEVDVFTALTTPAKLRDDYTQIGISIPKGHMRVLDSEANLMGLRRGQFLELLFLNAIGQRSIVRMPVSPKYDLKRDELMETTKYLWYVRKEVKRLFEAHLLRLGLRPSAWVVMALNDWADLAPKPGGG